MINRAKTNSAGHCVQRKTEVVITERKDSDLRLALSTVITAPIEESITTLKTEMDTMSSINVNPPFFFIFYW